jgi:predicted ATP-grasp superfamily ATP-dependent carboligase
MEKRMKGHCGDYALNVREPSGAWGSPEQQAQYIRSQKRELIYDAVVLDAQLRQSLTTVRSLGRRGKRVAALTTVSSLEKSKHVPTFSSRWCQTSSIVPAYEQHAESFLACLREFLDHTKARVLISSSDEGIEVLRANRAEIERRGTHLAIASEASLAIAIRKDRTLAIAEQLGLHIPKGVLLSGVSEVSGALHEIGLPAVVKPTESWLWTKQGGVRLTCKLVTTREEAHLAVQALTQYGGTVLLQQFLSGRQESVSLLYANGEVYARFAQWTKRTHPQLGGVSTFRQSIALPDDINVQAERLVREIDLEGYSQVQFRRDDVGKPYLMEINPRMTSGLEIAFRAGIDFPYLLYQWANQEHIDHIDGYRSGVRMRYLEGDLLTTLQTFAQRGRPGVTPPAKALAEFVATFFVPTGYDYFDWQDLRPAWSAAGETIDHLRNRIKPASYRSTIHHREF